MRAMLQLSRILNTPIHFHAKPLATKWLEKIKWFVWRWWILTDDWFLVEIHGNLQLFNSPLSLFYSEVLSLRNYFGECKSIWHRTCHRGKGRLHNYVVKFRFDCHYTTYLIQLLFSFDRGTRLEKTLMQTLACQFPSTLAFVSHVYRQLSTPLLILF